MILKAFWQQKFDIKRLYKGSNVSDRGYNVFVNVAIDLRIILSRQMFMRFSKKSIKKNYNIIFKTKGGGVNGFWTMFKITVDVVLDCTPKAAALVLLNAEFLTINFSFITNYLWKLLWYCFMSVCGNLHSLSLSSFFEGSIVIGINCGLKKAIISQNKARSCGHFSYGGGGSCYFWFWQCYQL